MAPSEHPNLTTKIGSKMGGEFTYQPKVRYQNGFDNHSHLFGSQLLKHHRRAVCARLGRLWRLHPNCSDGRPLTDAEMEDLWPESRVALAGFRGE